MTRSAKSCRIYALIFVIYKHIHRSAGENFQSGKRATRFRGKYVVGGCFFVCKLLQPTLLEILLCPRQRSSSSYLRRASRLCSSPQARRITVSRRCSSLKENWILASSSTSFWHANFYTPPSRRLSISVLVHETPLDDCHTSFFSSLPLSNCLKSFTLPKLHLFRERFHSYCYFELEKSVSPSSE